MISPVTQEEVIIHWDGIEDTFSKYWDVGVNYETLPNLKRRLLAQDCFLWAWTSEDKTAKFLFVSDSRPTATATIMTITHTAGINTSGKRWNRATIEGHITQIFEEVEDLARTLYFDAVCIHARPAHVKLAKGYTKMCQPIVKELTNIKRGT